MALTHTGGGDALEACEATPFTKGVIEAFRTLWKFELFNNACMCHSRTSRDNIYFVAVCADK